MGSNPIGSTFFLVRWLKILTYEIFIIMGIECKICDKKFENQNQLSGHMSVHNIGEFYCNECGKGPFDNISKLKGHQSVHKRKPRTKGLKTKNISIFRGFTSTHFR